MASPAPETHSGRHAVATCRIRVAGVLDEEWSGRAHGVAVSMHPSEPGASFTELSGAAVSGQGRLRGDQ